MHPNSTNLFRTSLRSAPRVSRLRVPSQSNDYGCARTILDACNEGILVLNTESRIMECNSSAAKILGHPVDVIRGNITTSPGSFLPVNLDGYPISEEEHPSRIVLRTGEPCLGHVHGLKHPDGHMIWLLVNAQPLRNRQGELIGVVVTMTDVTESKELEARLRREAYYDDLTQLHNRRYFLEALQRSVNASKRHGHPMSLCMCDLDHFKKINDTYGHSTGDLVLQSFAESIQLGLRRDDLAARLGGDEFCLLFPHSPASNAFVYVDRLRQSFEKTPIASDKGEVLFISASFGLTEFRPEMTNEIFIESADQALYRAKQNGRSRVECA